MKEKYYINEKTHSATEKNFVLHHSLKINKRKGDGGGPSKQVLINAEGVRKKSKN